MTTIELSPPDISAAELQPAYDGDPSPILSSLLDRHESEAASGVITDGLEDYILHIASATEVRENTTHGFTIPGTDEFIPGTTTTEYAYIQGEEKGNATRLPLDRHVGERLMTFLQAKQSTLQPQSTENNQQPADSEADSTSNTTENPPTDTATPPPADTSASPNASTNRPAPKRSTKRDGIADLIRLDTSGRARYESGVKLDDDHNAVGSLKGRMMPVAELDKIDAMQEVIRDGLPVRGKPDDATFAGPQWEQGRKYTVKELLDGGFKWQTSREAKLADLEAWGGLRYKNIGDPSSKRVSEKVYQNRLAAELAATEYVPEPATAEHAKRQVARKTIGAIGRMASRAVGFTKGIGLDIGYKAQEIAEWSKLTFEKHKPAVTEKLTAAQRRAAYLGRLAMANLADANPVNASELVNARTAQTDKETKDRARILKRRRNQSKNVL